MKSRSISQPVSEDIYCLQRGKIHFQTKMQKVYYISTVAGTRLFD